MVCKPFSLWRKNIYTKICVKLLINSHRPVPDDMSFSWLYFSVYCDAHLKASTSQKTNKKKFLSLCRCLGHNEVGGLDLVLKENSPLFPLPTTWERWNKESNVECDGSSLSWSLCFEARVRTMRASTTHAKQKTTTALYLWRSSIVALLKRKNRSAWVFCLHALFITQYNLQSSKISGGLQRSTCLL